jgi:SAM-dependent methyltransferase
MSRVYQNPKYYEIAFSFRDIAAEVDVFESLIRQYSLIPVSKMFEVGCGPAPHLVELARRGYAYEGLDLSPEMLAYSREKAEKSGASARFHQADMTDFELREQADFAFVLLGSLQARNTAELVSHFDCMGKALKSGGLYLLDWCVSFTSSTGEGDSWEIVQGPITVNATYRSKLIDPVEQINEESLTLEIEDAGVKKVIVETWVRREIYPQEFLLFIDARSDFEFIGWWNYWDLSQPLQGAQEISRPIAVLRRL